MTSTNIDTRDKLGRIATAISVDAQDRLLTSGDTSYSYSLNGEMQSAGVQWAPGSGLVSAHFNSRILGPSGL